MRVAIARRKTRRRSKSTRAPTTAAAVPIPLKNVVFANPISTSTPMPDVKAEQIQNILPTHSSKYVTPKKATTTTRRVMTVSDMRRKVTNPIQRKTYLAQRKKMEESFTKALTELAKEKVECHKDEDKGFNVFKEILKIVPVVELDDDTINEGPAKIEEKKSRRIIVKKSPGEMLKNCDAEIEVLDVDLREQQMSKKISRTRTLRSAIIKKRRSSILKKVSKISPSSVQEGNCSKNDLDLRDENSALRVEPILSRLRKRRLPWHAVTSTPINH